MAADSNKPHAPDDDPEAQIWEGLDDNDELDDAVIAADDTGMLQGEARITVVETNEALPPEPAD
jgi:hypothetical protein